MRFIPLLGKPLKDDDIIEILDWGEMDVIYEFDRLHENQPDRYSAAWRTRGIQLGFDVHQRLDVIFLYAVPTDGFSAFDNSECDIPFFSSPSEAEKHAATARLSKGEAVFLGVLRHWVRLDFPSHSAHYEFQEGVLTLVTLSRVV